MTIPQLFAQGVRKVRLPEWNKFAYIELIELSGQLTPWGKLWDIGCAGRDVLLIEEKADTFEEWTEERLADLPADYIHAVYHSEFYPPV